MVSFAVVKTEPGAGGRAASRPLASAPAAVAAGGSAAHEHAVLSKEERKERYLQKTRAEAAYLFKYLILTQIVVYLEAGAIPCLLDQLSVALQLDATEQGALGGVVYLALSAASPFCAYLLHKFNPRIVLGLSLLFNNLAMLLLAGTPTGYPFSASLMIVARGLIGFTQAFVCVYTPLWVDEYAPREKVAGWMSYLQGSVPMGVMLGYFLGTVSNWFVPESGALFETWRWPFVLQFIGLLPINVAVFFVPKKHLMIRSDKSPNGSVASSSEGVVSTSDISEETHTIDLAEEATGTATVTVTAPGSGAGEKDRLIANGGAPLSGRGTGLQFEDKSAGAGEYEPLSGRGDSMGGMFNYFDDALTTPLSTRSTRHDEEDALLASAAMYGSSSQRGLRQLHQNQQQYHFGLPDNDVGSSSLRRSMMNKRGQSMMDIAAELENEELKRSSSHQEPGEASIPPAATTVAISRIAPSSQKLRTAASSTYGAMDTALTPIKSPQRSYLEASIFDEEFMDEDFEQGAFLDGIYELFHIPVFLLIVMGLTTIYFVVTGVQYWSTIFMIKSLHASKYLVNALFVFVAGTGPIFGVFFGGWLIDRCGGYIGVEQRAKALGICMVLGLTAFGIGAGATYFQDVYITAGFLWLLLFFGGSILPACTGIFISVVPAAHRALASSFSVMVFNLFGYSLSPYLTGLIMDWVISKEGEKGGYFEFCDEACVYRIGFRFCLCWSVWSVLCIGSAWRLAARQAREARQMIEFYSSKEVLEC